MREDEVNNGGDEQRRERNRSKNFIIAENNFTYNLNLLGKEFQ